MKKQHFKNIFLRISNQYFLIYSNDKKIYKLLFFSHLDNITNSYLIPISLILYFIKEKLNKYKKILFFNIF